MDVNSIIAKELNLNISQVNKTVALMDEGNTIPFIARYRKEVTGNMDEEVLRTLDERVNYLRNLEERKKQIISSIEEQGKMTRELNREILDTWKLNKLEDLYLPFRPKRKTRAGAAREKGLTPLADMILKDRLLKERIDREAVKFINPEKELNSLEDVISGAKDIVAEVISENSLVRDILREMMEKEGKLFSRAVKKEDPSNYEIYYDYSENYSSIPPHRVLAINRGEREKFLKVSINIDEEKCLNRLACILGFREKEGYLYFWEALEDGFKRLLYPSIEREMRKAKTEKAEKKSMEIFSRNLKNLLLQSPLKGHRIMGIDPGFRTGCKAAAIDEKGDLLVTATIYTHPPQNKKEESASVISEILKAHNIKFIAVGNGTACRETEAFMVEVIEEFSGDVSFTIVNEAGASVYSASPLAKK